MPLALPVLIPLLTKARIRKQTAPDGSSFNFPEASSTAYFPPLSIYTIYHAPSTSLVHTPLFSPTISSPVLAVLKGGTLNEKRKKSKSEPRNPTHSGGTNQQILLDPHYPSTASLTPFPPQSTPSIYIFQSSIHRRYCAESLGKSGTLGQSWNRN